MRRRDLIVGIGGAALAGPRLAEAQQKMPVIGILGTGFAADPAIALNLEAFRQGLKNAGFTEGENVAIEYRWADNHLERLPALAAELVARKVDVIVTEGGTPSAVAAKNASSTIPVVFHARDAIADGIVANLARPGGNLTGVSLLGPESVAKQFQLLLELVPTAKVVALLAVPNSSTFDQAAPAIRDAATAKGLQLKLINAATDGEIETAFAALGQLRANAVVFANATFADKLAMLAARYAVPMISGQRAFATAGGLISYGASLPDAYVTKGFYTGKILAGAKPADLPVQQPTKFELVVNLKTAKAFGLTVPQSILARADELIE